MCRRKTMGTAYLLWFFLGGFSAHRFYLGFSTSAIVQLLLTPIGYAMLMSKSPAGFIFVAAGGLVDPCRRLPDPRHGHQGQ